MWQFDKALRLDLYGQDDVCTNTANNIRSMVFTVTTSTKKTRVLATFSRVYSASDSISLCSMYSCQYIPCPVLLQLQGEEFLCKQTRYVTHDA